MAYLSKWVKWAGTVPATAPVVWVTFWARFLVADVRVASRSQRHSPSHNLSSVRAALAVCSVDYWVDYWVAGGAVLRREGLRRAFRRKPSGLIRYFLKVSIQAVSKPALIAWEKYCNRAHNPRAVLNRDWTSCSGKYSGGDDRYGKITARKITADQPKTHLRNG